MNYVDGFVSAVPSANKAAYLAYIRSIVPVFRENGALRMVESWGRDVPEGEVTSFPMAVKRNEDETVVLSWIEWPSKEVRDAGMGKVMADPRFKAALSGMPLDGKRVIHATFDMIVDA